MLPADDLVVNLSPEDRRRLRDIALELAPGWIRGECRGPLLVVYRGLALVNACDLGTGGSVPISWRGTSRLDRLAAESGYDRILALDESAPERVYGLALQEQGFESDYARRILGLMRGVSHEWRRTIFTCPKGPRRLRVISYGVLSRALGMLLGGDGVLLLALSERERSCASLVVGHSGGAIRLLTSLESAGLRDERLDESNLPPLLEKLEEKYRGRPSAVVIDRQAFDRIAASPFPAGSILWSYNTGAIRLEGVPLRSKAVCLAAALALTPLARRRSRH